MRSSEVSSDTVYSAMRLIIVFLLLKFNIMQTLFFRILEEVELCDRDGIHFRAFGT